MTDKKQDEQAVTPPVVRLAAAEVDSVAAKDRLNDTVARLQSKLDPKLLAKEASDEAKRVGGKGLDLARDNQSILGGLAGGALLFLLARPILRLFKRRKYPKPQKAAKPMTATAPNDRLARSPHPAEPRPDQPAKAPRAPSRLKTSSTLDKPGPAPVTASNEGAFVQGSIA